MGSSHGWLTYTLGQIVGLLRSVRITRLHRYHEPVRPCASHRYSIPHGSTTWRSPFASRQQVPTFHTRACPGLTPSSCRSPLGPSAGTVRASSQAKRWSLVSVTSIRFRHVINGSLAFVFPGHTGRVRPAFSVTLTTPAIGPAPLPVVWTLTLQSESEGPTLISCAAKLQ